MNNRSSNFSSFCIAGSSSGDGKTTVAVALLRALYRRGLSVQPFKCGPDYIDPTFHRIACKRQGRNLDAWMMGPEAVRVAFANACVDADCAVVEGVMGLFDGAAPDALEGSTAQIAALVNSGIILTVNARGLGGSIAALVKGYAEFDRNTRIIGVIANQVGSEKHAALLAAALRAADLPPLLGFLPRNAAWELPERHLGLVPFTENVKDAAWFDGLADAAEQYFNIDLILRLSRVSKPAGIEFPVRNRPKFSMGLAMDQAFHFYYPDNLELLERRGFELVPFSPLTAKALPENCAALYVGGGFPEEFAAGLAANIPLRRAVKAFSGTILAECGGYMYLSEALNGHEMCGAIPARTVMGGSLRALGYRRAETRQDSFLGPAGVLVRGHEFHWSDIDESNLPPAWHCARADGSPVGDCGFGSKNIIAGYIHIHFASNPEIADNWYDYIEQENKRRC
ncbi:MAG: cobyrinate a,c-diamide synthase [Victivallaceae bacterium]|nr:cobyrinate a,c-diamide synthase [Victivallaceae bacterium]